MNKNINKIFENVLFWKESTEILLGKHSNLIKKNWAEIYQVVSRSVEHTNPIAYAVTQESADAIEVLIEAGYDPSIINNQAIKQALESIKENLEIVRLLLKDPRVNPSFDNNYAIKTASKNGHSEVVRLLLKDQRVDPAADNNKAIKIASENGHLEVVEILFEDLRVDPYVDNNSVIKLAVKNKHNEIVKFLMENENFDAFVPNLIDDIQTHKMIHEYIEDSFQGLTAMHYLGNRNIRILSEFSPEIFRTGYENDDNMIGLYNKFLRYLVRKKHSTINCIKTLTKFSRLRNPDVLSVINNAAYSIISNDFSPLTKMSDYYKNYYYAFRGFIMLAFDPPYKYFEILDKIQFEGASEQAISLAAKLLGAKIGWNKLIEDGFIPFIRLSHYVSAQYIKIGWDNNLLLLAD